MQIGYKTSSRSKYCTLIQLWQDFQHWMYSFGKHYGVDPLIFALLYFGTIPFSLLAFAWLGQNLRRSRSIYGPVALAFFSFIGTYVYLFSMGKNLPWWIYGLVGGALVGGAWVLFRRIRRMQLQN